MPNKAIKFVSAAKGAASTGDCLRCTSAGVYGGVEAVEKLKGQKQLAMRVALNKKTLVNYPQIQVRSWLSSIKCPQKIVLEFFYSLVMR